MKLIEKWWCADVMSGADAHERRASSLPQALRRLRKMRSCVQAGGHIGVYARILGLAFDDVYTFEPEAENFACLVMNTTDNQRIYPLRSFLGAEHGRRALRLHSKSSGGHSLGGEGSIPMLCIDDLQLADCDAIFLDVEGTEFDALRGAMQTIKRCRPLLVLEENKKMHNRGRVAGDLQQLVEPFGYTLVDRLGEDIILEAACAG